MKISTFTIVTFDGAFVKTSLHKDVKSVVESLKQIRREQEFSFLPYTSEMTKDMNVDFGANILEPFAWKNKDNQFQFVSVERHFIEINIEIKSIMDEF